MTSENSLPAGFQGMLEFGLVEAQMGRRAGRFFMGAEIPDGVLAYKSRHNPVPLSELEKLLVVTACGGNTGWHQMIYRAKLYAPHLSNYSGAAGGRSFPSAAGFHNRFGKFPGTVPSMISTIYLQAHHLNLAFYDNLYKPDSYLRTHAHHMARWHGAKVHGAPGGR